MKHPKTALGSVAVGILAATFALVPAVSASADTLQGPYSTLAKCNTARTQWLHDTDVRVTSTCYYHQIHPNQWYFEWVWR